MAKKRIKTVLAILAAAVVAAGIFVIAVNLYIINKTQKYIYPIQKTDGVSADCIVVLGAGIREDGTPSDMLRDRLDTAVALYEKGVSDKILLTGDHGREGYDEVGAMKDYVLERGIPAESVYCDHAGFSTYDSMYRAKEIFMLENPVIVTQKYHLYRALYLARGFGMNACGVNSDAYVYVGQTMRDIREYVARTKDFLSLIFKPLPKYLGEPIPVSSSPASATYG